MSQIGIVPNSNAAKLNLCPNPWSKYENMGKMDKIQK